MKIYRRRFLFLILLWPLLSCSKLKEALPGKKDWIVTPDGDVFKSEKEWDQRTKHFNSRYRRLHLRMIRSVQDWKQYILDIFPEASENPPATIPAFSQQASERSLVLYSDFLHTGKPNVIFMETMPNLPTIKTLAVSEWNQNQWTELLRIDQYGMRNPYMLPGQENKEFKGYTIKLPYKADTEEKKYFVFDTDTCDFKLDRCHSSDTVVWDTEIKRYCFMGLAPDPDVDPDSDENGDDHYRTICEEKDWDRYRK